MLRFLTSGESHGRALITVLEGIPSGLTIDFTALGTELRRRQGGYGRGRRMIIETDRADIISGVRHGGHRVCVTVADRPGTIREVADLAAAGAPVTRIEVAGPTLDDVFLELTGRSLRESNESSEAPEPTDHATTGEAA